MKSIYRAQNDQQVFFFLLSVIIGTPAWDNARVIKWVILEDFNKICQILLRKLHPQMLFYDNYIRRVTDGVWVEKKCTVKQLKE